MSIGRFHFRGALSWANHPDPEERDRGRLLKRKRPSPARPGNGQLTNEHSDRFAALRASVDGAHPQPQYK